MIEWTGFDFINVPVAASSTKILFTKNGREKKTWSTANGSCVCFFFSAIRFASRNIEHVIRCSCLRFPNGKEKKNTHKMKILRQQNDRISQIIGLVGA